MDKTFSRSYVSLSKLAVIPHWIVALAFKLCRQQFDDIARLGSDTYNRGGHFLSSKIFRPRYILPRQLRKYDHNVSEMGLA